ncbi:MAG: 16S rRNA (guanine(527)-N(7))-methyltransferase RsmG [Actinomycetia bacterium]|nr:16S rRNA (guanine(527)-N(7))-methyltransferase RsmG [Actinomycetes bacterium]
MSAWGEGPGAGELAAQEAARELFGARFELIARYGQLLATVGVQRGLVGPREAPRLWERHLMNCAVVGELLPRGVRVVDVGSGAGLPGIVLACARPDLRMDLVEPMQRRVEFLEQAVAELGLGEAVRVVRGRAEDPEVRRAVGRARWATARAVAPLVRLVGWVMPLLAPGGVLLAIKGARAAQELAAAVGDPGWPPVGAELLACGGSVLATPARVISVRNGNW